MKAAWFYMVMALGLAGPLAASTAPEWRISGDLSEACNCSVPCTCNFAESPSPHAFCWAMFSLDIQEGRYGGVDLAGLRLAGANGAKGMVFYIDDRATAEQAQALKAMATAMHRSALKANGVTAIDKAPPEFRLRGFKRAHIEQQAGERNAKLRIGNAGAFDQSYIIGLDGKTPVTVENNWSWNIQHGIKGKTSTFHYKDGYGNQFSYKGTNANQGKFDWSDKTPIYFR